MPAQTRLLRPVQLASNALVATLDWRLILIWTIGMLLPALIAALPFWRTLGDTLDYSPLSPELARHFDVLVFEDLLAKLRPVEPALGGAGIVALGCFAGLSPLFSAAILAMVAHGPSTGFVALLARAVSWYGRALRMWLVSLLPIIAVLAVGSALTNRARDYAQHAVLESRADLVSLLAIAASALLAVLAHVTIEAGRAELALDPSRKSAFLAWIRGTRRSLRWPLQTLAAYSLPSLASLLLAALLLLVRLRVASATHFCFGLGVLITQLAVASIGWGRAGRLQALANSFRAEPRAL